MKSDGYITKKPYAANSYENMLKRNALAKGLTPEAYSLAVSQVNALQGLDLNSIVYKSDGLRVTGLEALPKLKPNEKLPLVIYNRGGSGDYGMIDPRQILGTIAPLAKGMRAGVLATNYRGNGGSEGREEFGGSDVADIINLIEIGKKQPWWDGKNIFMIGWSRGSMMSYLTLKHGASVNAIVCGGGVSNLLEENQRRPQMNRVCQRLIPNYDDNSEELLRDRSVAFWPEMVSAPLLLLHGEADKAVDVSQSRQLKESLERQGKKVRYVEFCGGDHALSNHRTEVINESIQWFKRYLKRDIAQTL